MAAQKTGKQLIIDSVVKTGKRIQVPFGFIATKSFDSDPLSEAYTDCQSSYSISVSKAFSKLAVKRNKIRRKVESILRKNNANIREKKLFISLFVKKPVLETEILEFVDEYIRKILH